MDLRNGDCLELIKSVPDNSVDLVFADLPYLCTDCKWDKEGVNLESLWKELLRVGKINTPFFFTCTTRFGYELINSNKKMFRCDFVWVKSVPVGFLNCRRRPMRKHEMIYLFWQKQPLYDLSSHKHKFKDNPEYKEKAEGEKTGDVYHNDGVKKIVYKGLTEDEIKYTEEDLPTSVIKEEGNFTKCLKENGKVGGVYEYPKGYKNTTSYDPPLPTSVIKEDFKFKIDPNSKSVQKSTGKLKAGVYPEKKLLYDKKKQAEMAKKTGSATFYDPPLPTSVLEIPSKRIKQHSTSKPVDLMKWILKYYSKEGDNVLDPVMGSNSMGVACKDMKRKFIGFEKDDEIFKFACERVEFNKDNVEKFIII